MDVALGSWAVPFGLAIALLALGVPQFRDALGRLDAGDWPMSIPLDQPALRQQAAAAARRLESLDVALDDAGAEAEAGMLNFRLSFAPDGVPPDAAERIRQAIVDLTGALRRAPANSLAWTTLAHAYQSAGDGARARDAWRESLLLAYHDPSLSLWRCQLGLGLWPLLDDGDRRLWQEQVVSAWHADPDGVVTLAMSGAGLPQITSALADDPAELAAFDQALREHH